METALNYGDVWLTPRYSELESRSQTDIRVEFLGRKFAAPFLPANMQSVVNEDICKWLSLNNYPYIYHRFGDTRKFIQRARSESWPFVSISVGVKAEDRELINDIAETKCRVHWVTIDIAHGDSILTKDMIGYIRSKLPDVKIIAGNVATPEAVKNLTIWGADAAKVGIAGGGACSTKNMTGFHIPMFSCVKNCRANGGREKPKPTLCVIYVDRYNPLTEQDVQARELHKSQIPLIADGGIRENGDFAKALVAGGNLVMAGSIFAACIDAPGEDIYNKYVEDAFLNGYSRRDLRDMAKNGFDTSVKFKRYYGSASAKQKGEKKHVEGFELELPCNGMTYEEKYKELSESLKSSVSYSGGKDLSALKNVQWISTK